MQIKEHICTQPETNSIASSTNLAHSFSSRTYVTIDSETTQDIDDALHVAKEGDGFIISVAIANPTALVQIDSTEDIKALRLGATVYMRDRPVHRMLPIHISESGASLLEGKERSTLVFDTRLSAELEVVEFKVRIAKICVAQRLCYSQIPTIIGSADHPLHAMIGEACQLARRMLQRRRQRGALAIFDLGRLIYSDEEGNLRQLRSAEETIGYVLVQEMMILTNMLTASYMVEHDIPAIFRNHQPKLAAPKADELANTIEAWMATHDANIEQLQSQFRSVAGKATYGASTHGHYGLNLPCYSHITSPLRRYADLVNIRQLVAHIKQKKTGIRILVCFKAHSRPDSSSSISVFMSAP